MRSYSSCTHACAEEQRQLAIQVDYYGAATPLKSLAGVSAPESTLLVVQPYDMSAMQLIEKAIMASDLNLTPSNDGKLIRINIPSLTAVSASAHCSCKTPCAKGYSLTVAIALIMHITLHWSCKISVQALSLQQLLVLPESCSEDKKQRLLQRSVVECNDPTELVYQTVYESADPCTVAIFVARVCRTAGKKWLRRYQS